MRVEIVARGPVVVANLAGELDHHAAETVRVQLDQAMDRLHPPRVVLDLSQLAFMDSSGLGVILGRYKRIKERGGVLAISGTSPAVERLFALSGMHRIVTLYHAQDEAVRAVKEVAL